MGEVGWGGRPCKEFRKSRGLGKGGRTISPRFFSLSVFFFSSSKSTPPIDSRSDFEMPLLAEVSFDSPEPPFVNEED